MLAFKLTSWYGTLPDWFAAVGTVGTFIAGLWLLRNDQKDRRRAQARLVAAWTDIERIPGTDGPPIAPPAYEHIFIVRNGSEEPVYDLSVVMVAETSPFADDPEAAWQKDGTLEAGAVYAHFSLVPPGERIRNTIAGGMT